MENKTRIEAARKKLLESTKVDEYDIEALLVKSQKADGSTELILEAQTAFAIFYAMYPDGALIHEFNLVNLKSAIVTAKAFKNKTDVIPMSTATVTRIYSEADGIHAQHFIQNAVTAAKKKALAYIGIAPQRGMVEVEGIDSLNSASLIADEFTEKGIETPPKKVVTDASEILLMEGRVDDIPKCINLLTPNPEEARVAPPAVPEKKKVKKEKVSEPVKTEKVEKPAEPTPELTSEPEELTLFNANPETPTEQIALAVDTAEVTPPVEPEKQPSKTNADSKNVIPTYEEALEAICPIGKAVGLTIKDAAAKYEPKVIRWILEKIKPNPEHNWFVPYAQVFCEAEGV